MTPEGWLARTFRDSEDAVAALAEDRQRFLQHKDILQFIPREIKHAISHPYDNSQIKGFDELFVYLSTSWAAHELRERIVSYFGASPHLREHLKSPPVISKMYPSDYQREPPTSSSGWTSNTFIDSEAAQMELRYDREFLGQHGLVAYLPPDIRVHIFHSSAFTRGTGFKELFTLLNTDPEADGLRQLVVNYFNNSLSLRKHLRHPFDPPLPFSKRSSPDPNNQKTDTIMTPVYARNDIRAWFTDQKGRSLLAPSRIGTPVLDLTVSELCVYVNQLVDLQKARIISTESYSIGLRHRILVLKLQRPHDPKGAYLRLKILSPDNPRATLSIRKYHLSRLYTLKNRQMFRRQPTIGVLCVMLEIACDELGSSRGPMTGLVLCVLIQELLGDSYGGDFNIGELRVDGIPPEARRRIYMRFINFVCVARSGVELLERPQMQPETATPSVFIATQSSDIVQDSLQPSLPETPRQEAASLSSSKLDLPRGQASKLPLASSQRLPSISEVVPSTGPVAGGIGIAVLGSHFSQSTRCFFGSQEAATTWLDEGTLICALPQSREPGPVTVTVRVRGAAIDDNGDADQPHFIYQGGS